MLNLQKKNNAHTVVVIPSYEPPRAFVDYVKELLSHGVAGVVVVSDGSGEKYKEVYDDLGQITGCHVISYEQNQGKGYALKTAFKYCLESFDPSYSFVTADCDGQHLAEDVLNVAEKAREHTGKLILGSRDFSAPNVPARSRAGNIQTRRLFKLLYGISLSDTQTGLRAFSYDLLEPLINVKGTRFEYEMNMLIVFHKKHYDILEVPIATVYNEKSDDVERVSHFKTVSDSLRVISTLFKNLGWYFLSSTLSAVVDVVAFFLLATFVFTRTEYVAINMLLTTVSARILSSIINFIFNFKFVFNGRSKRSVFRYYVLWTAQLSISYGIACLWNSIFDNVHFGLTLVQIGLLTTLLKGICDIIVAMLSYQIQSRWVFASVEHDRFHFYGIYFRFCRFFYNIFTKNYNSFVLPDEKEPVVYVCRHLNLHGPIKVCQDFGFDVHLFVLNNFFTFKKCFHQYSTYTFTARYGKKGISAFFGKVAAFFAALAVAPLVRSAKSIPVWRGGSDSLVTFKKANEYLSRGENVILFPDKEYTNSADEKSDIYTGFLFIDKVYFRSTGKHLRFAVVNIDDEKREIHEIGSVAFSEGRDFKEEMPEIAEKIHYMLMNGAVSD